MAEKTSLEVPDFPSDKRATEDKLDFKTKPARIAVNFRR
jgi:hypothetical protein